MGEKLEWKREVCGRKRGSRSKRRVQRERKRGGEREAVRRLQHYVWRAPSIKQVFEKGRQREKVSAKYLKECREERGARPEGDKAVSRTLRPAPVSLDRVTPARVRMCVCLRMCSSARSSIWAGRARCRHSRVVCLCSWSSEVADKAVMGKDVCGASGASPGWSDKTPGLQMWASGQTTG